MADFDILFDKAFVQKVCNILITLGFTCEEFGKGNHDVYHKQPVLNFEMHRSLFVKSTPYYEYYQNVKNRLIKNEDNAYGYHFSMDDFYIYIYLHFAKHLHGSGTGIRSLADLYLYRTHHPNLNSSYISAELSRFDVSEEEEFIQKSIRKLFSLPDPEFFSSLDPEEYNFLFQFLDNGTYGSLKNRISKNLNRYNQSSRFARKLLYLTDRLLPDAEEKLPYFPAFFSRHKCTMPLFYIYRFFNRLIVSRKKLWKEIKLLIRL